MTAARPLCLLIADTRHELFPLVAAQWAALRGLKCLQWNTAEAGFVLRWPGSECSAGVVVPHVVLLEYSGIACRESRRVAGSDAIRARRLSDALKMFVLAFRLGRVWDFFLPRRMVICSPTTGCCRKCSGMNRQGGGEPGGRAIGRLRSASAGRHPRLAAASLPFILAMPCGAGVVIYDLMPDEVPAGAETPIVEAFGGPRPRAVSSLGRWPRSIMPSGGRAQCSAP